MGGGYAIVPRRRAHSPNRDVAYPTVRRCREAERATAELEGTAAHSVQERAKRAIAPNVRVYAIVLMLYTRC